MTPQIWDNYCSAILHENGSVFTKTIKLLVGLVLMLGIKRWVEKPKKKAVRKRRPKKTQQVVAPLNQSTAHRRDSIMNIPKQQIRTDDWPDLIG